MKVRNFLFQFYRINLKSSRRLWSKKRLALTFAQFLKCEMILMIWWWWRWWWWWIAIVDWGKSYYHSEKLPEGLKSASAETPVSTVVYPYGSSLFCKLKFIKCSAHMVQLKWCKYVFSDIFFMWHPNIMRSKFVRKFTN